MGNKKVISIVIIVLFVIGAVSLYSIDFPALGMKAKLKQMESVGIIDSIKFAGHGYPYFYINKEWKDFGMFGYSMIRIYGLHTGDSISKKMGETSVLTFKRDTLNNRFGVGVIIQP